MFRNSRKGRAGNDRASIYDDITSNIHTLQIGQNYA